MKKILLLLCLLCGFVFAKEIPQKPIIAVSLPMQKEFVEKIVSDKFSVISLVEAGSNPHDFEPKFSVIKQIDSAVAYFAIGIEFEEVWLEKFKAQNPNMQIFNTQNGIKKINFAEQKHGHNHSHKGHNHHNESGDTHIWLSPAYAKIIAENIFNALKKLDSTQDFSKGYNDLITEISQTQNNLKSILKELPNAQKFVVFHPMLGYFAKDYNLVEISIEIEGKSPKMQEMIEVIETIKKEKLKVIFAQPEFSTKAAEFIAKESGAKLGYFSPLKTPWSENLINFAKELVELQNR